MRAWLETFRLRLSPASSTPDNDRDDTDDDDNGYTDDHGDLLMPAEATSYDLAT